MEKYLGIMTIDLRNGFRDRLRKVEAAALSVAAMQNGDCLQIIADQDIVELLLRQALGGFVSERIVTGFPHRLSPRMQDSLKYSLAGTVAQNAVVVSQLNVIGIDLDRSQASCSMPAYPGVRCVLCYRFLNHSEPTASAD
jgi:hypothetical protein